MTQTERLQMWISNDQHLVKTYEQIAEELDPDEQPDRDTIAETMWAEIEPMLYPEGTTAFQMDFLPTLNWEVKDMVVDLVLDYRKEIDDQEKEDRELMRRMLEAQVS